MFQKCKEYGINLNSNKCAFMVFSRMILGFIVFEEGKLPNLKKIQVIFKHATTKVFNGMAWFYKCFIKKFATIMALINKLIRKTKVFLWTKKC
jgi:hypothetical protein